MQLCASSLPLSLSGLGPPPQQDKEEYLKKEVEVPVPGHWQWLLQQAGPESIPPPFVSGIATGHAPGLLGRFPFPVRVSCSRNWTIIDFCFWKKMFLMLNSLFLRKSNCYWLLLSILMSRCSSVLLSLPLLSLCCCSWPQAEWVHSPQPKVLPL